MKKARFDIMDWAEHDHHRRSAPSRDGVARMAGRLGILPAVSHVRRLGGGLGSATHLVSFTGGRSVVVKRYPLGTESVGSEWERLCFAHGAGGPAPEPLAVDVAGEWFGCPTIVMAPVPGRADLSPKSVDGYLAEVVNALARIQRVDVSAATGAVVSRHPVDAWSPPDSTPSGLLTRQLAERLLEQVIARMPFTDARPTVFNHSDFHPGNLMWSRGRMTGVVDWSGARVGYAAWDVAYFANEVALLLGDEVAGAFEQRYQAEVGPINDLITWRLLCAYNAHKWAGRWLIAWHEQGRQDLTLQQVKKRLTAMTRRLLGA